MQGHDTITSSALKTARACLRQYEIAYKLGIRPRETAGALRFGTAMHTELEGRWRYLEDGLWPTTSPDDPFDAAKVRALMAGYCARWEDDRELYEVLYIEEPFSSAMRTPTGRHSSKWRMAGKMDGVIRERESKRVLILEHKTTSEDIRVGSDYWTRLRMDAQVSIYYDGAAALGLDVQGVLYDVIAKPALQPYKATPTESRKYKKDGTLYATQRDRDETPDEYEQRLLEAIAAAPERYYQRAEVVRLESEIAASRRDIWETSRIIAAGHFPRNVDACLRYGRACAYLPVCSGAGSLDDERYQNLEQAHPELEGE